MFKKFVAEHNPTDAGYRPISEYISGCFGSYEAMKNTSFWYLSIFEGRVIARPNYYRISIPTPTIQPIHMMLQQWALVRLPKLSPPLDEGELQQLVSDTSDLSDLETSQYLQNILGDDPETFAFIGSFIEQRAELGAESHDEGSQSTENPAHADTHLDSKGAAAAASGDFKGWQSDEPPQPPPDYASSSSQGGEGVHTNVVMEAAKRRAVDEQEMQQELLTLQNHHHFYNEEVVPEHQCAHACICPLHLYQKKKAARLRALSKWTSAVIYPGEKLYNDVPGSGRLYNNNPYLKTKGPGTPYGPSYLVRLNVERPKPSTHATWIRRITKEHERLNNEVQSSADAAEPDINIWEDIQPAESMETTSQDDAESTAEQKVSGSQKLREKLRSIKKVVHHGKTPENKSAELRQEILAEESGRWPDEQWRQVVAAYQKKVGMTNRIADLRARCPSQYLHLLRAGYFEPIPVAWATDPSNMLRFSIEPVVGWRGITPAWRGYHDLAEERLHWVINHREGSAGLRVKPDLISEIDMARARMATAEGPPSSYISADDVCHVQRTSDGYSKQVMPSVFRALDQPPAATDDTMILLDVSGSMDFDPLRPVYEQYLITGYTRSTQPKNKDLAKAIVGRFITALMNRDGQASGYDMVTFADRAEHIGTATQRNFEQIWNQICFGGGTRLMTGWQKIKEIHFQKHHESATYHPVYGWEAGPETPMLRLLIVLDGEASDMDEFELDLLGLSWAHVTIFLIGVDGCIHHHRHANKLQRISDFNHNVSFVDAQGNCPERFVTLELLKRHLGHDISMQEFEEMEQPPPYIEYWAP